MLAAFVAICGGLAIWPAQKNLGTLLSCSAAVMLATQFWHAHQGGLYMAWYLPLLILTIFRPNLEDRVALSAVRPAWGWEKKRLRAEGCTKGTVPFSLTRKSGQSSSVPPGVERVGRLALGGVPLPPELLVEAEALSGDGGQGIKHGLVLEGHIQEFGSARQHSGRT